MGGHVHVLTVWQIPIFINHGYFDFMFHAALPIHSDLSDHINCSRLDNSVSSCQLRDSQGQRPFIHHQRANLGKIAGGMKEQGVQYSPSCLSSVFLLSDEFRQYIPLFSVTMSFHLLLFGITSQVYVLSSHLPTPVL